ncbi:MAG: hypothetical protein CMM77_00375 [Rhodospirillaceae bacterium]|nr:hypothetical protein [Rhodospirillaceae bacterium]
MGKTHWGSTGRWATWAAVALLFMTWHAPVAGASDTCAAAHGLFQADATGADEDILARVLKACPSHSLALNNLAVVRENQGRLAEAKALYERSIAHGGGAAPYAGLGDVFVKQGEKEKAGAAYRKFLELLKDEIAKGDPLGLAVYEEIYRRKLESLGQQVPPAGLVSAETVTRGLTEPPKPSRGVTLVYHERPHINVAILFEFDSARLTPQARAQLTEIARALRSENLKGSRILIEGHTDSRDDAGYNLDLSLRRARAVRATLISMKISETRLIPTGRGETQPISENESEAGRQRNRRVTFVNLGGR